MTVVEFNATPSHRYFMRKTKEELVRFIELHKHGRALLSYREIDEQKRVYSKGQLASECMKVLRSMPNA